MNVCHFAVQQGNETGSDHTKASEDFFPTLQSMPALSAISSISGVFHGTGDSSSKSMVLPLWQSAGVLYLIKLTNQN